MIQRVKGHAITTAASTGSSPAEIIAPAPKAMAATAGAADLSPTPLHTLLAWLPPDACWPCEVSGVQVASRQLRGLLLSSDARQASPGARYVVLGMFGLVVMAFLTVAWQVAAVLTGKPPHPHHPPAAAQRARPSLPAHRAAFWGTLSLRCCRSYRLLQASATAWMQRPLAFQAALSRRRHPCAPRGRAAPHPWAVPARGRGV